MFERTGVRTSSFNREAQFVDFVVHVKNNTSNGLCFRHNFFYCREGFTVGTISNTPLIHSTCMCSGDEKMYFNRVLGLSRFNFKMCGRGLEWGVGKNEVAVYAGSKALTLV